MGSRTDPKISAIIATHNRHHVLDGAIASLLHQNVDCHAFEVIVIDNSSEQARCAHVREKYAGIDNLRYVFETTQGLSNARNCGTHLARSQIVAFMDDDAIAAPDWIQQILITFEIWGGRAGCVGGRVLPRWITKRPDWLHDRLLGFLTIVDWGGQMRELGRDEWISGCNMAFHRDALLSIGGFSQELGRKGSNAVLLSNEELDVSEKLKARGKLTIYAPSMVVEHIIDSSRLTKKWFRRRAAWQTVSDFIMNPERAEAAAQEAAARLRELRHELLDLSKDDATATHNEITAISCLSLLLLSGSIDPNLVGARRSSLWSLLHRMMRVLRNGLSTLYAPRRKAKPHE